MSKSADALIFATPRTDAAKIAGDLTTGQPSGAVPLRSPIVRPPSIGNTGAAARISGDMVTGEPPVLPQPDGAIEKVLDSCTTLPRREVEP